MMWTDFAESFFENNDKKYDSKKESLVIDDYQINFVISLDLRQIRSCGQRNHDLDSSRMVYLSFDVSINKLPYQLFLEGMNYEDGDDVKVIQIHLAEKSEDGSTI